MSEEGEQIFVFCYGNGDNNINFLAAMSYNGPFAEPGRLEYGFNESALPSELEDDALVLPHEDNYIYRGPENASPDQLKAFMKDATYWEGSAARYSLSNAIASPGGSGAVHLGVGAVVASVVASSLSVLLS